MAQALARQIDGLRISGPETWPPDLPKPRTWSERALLPAYLGSLGKWLFDCPLVIDIGWDCLHMHLDPDDFAEAGLLLARQGLEGAGWFNLVDPDINRRHEPPWALQAGLENCGLLSSELEPKNFAESWIQQARSGMPDEDVSDFIDIAMDDYLDDPSGHFVRLWDHFRE